MYNQSSCYFVRFIQKVLMQSLVGAEYIIRRTLHTKCVYIKYHSDKCVPGVTFVFWRIAGTDKSAPGGRAMNSLTSVRVQILLCCRDLYAYIYHEDKAMSISVTAVLIRGIPAVI